MKTKLFSLLVLGTMLFGVACSDKESVAGSTEDPNMVTADTSSYVLCRRVLGNDAVDLSLSDCFWSAEMWNPESGYRVQTGYDNGSNTSGIWTWFVDSTGDRDIRVEWGAPVTADYDSMALAKVIDKCKGSLCGKVVFGNVIDSVRNLREYTRENVVKQSSFSVGFSFTGKNDRGNFERIDAMDMGGFCVEYIGENVYLELDLGDSLNALKKGFLYSVHLPEAPLDQYKDSTMGREACFRWEDFGLKLKDVHMTRYSALYDSIPYYLQGLRFTVRRLYEYSAGEEYFNIIGIGRYHKAFARESLHPVNESCKVVSVLSYQCGCNFTDEDKILKNGKRTAIDEYADSLFEYAYMKKEFRSYAMERCLLEKSEPVRFRCEPLRIDVSPCGDELAREVLCEDGSTSETREYAEALSAYNARVDEVAKAENLVYDSLVAYCESLHDTLDNGESLPDTCRIESWIVDREAFMHEWYEDAEPSETRKLAQEGKYCVRKYLSLNPSTSETQAVIKSVRCEGGTRYYTDEYKQILERLDFQDEEPFEECVQIDGEDGDIPPWVRIECH